MDRQTIAFDTETYPIREHGKSSNLVCPRMVCLSWSDGNRTQLLNHEDGAAWFVRQLRDEYVELVGHNVSFDLAVGARAADEFLGVDVSDEVFEALEAERIRDTMLREQLHDIGKGGMFRRGGYSLADLSSRHLDVELEGKGPGAWRTRYNELFGEPIDEWPEPARKYAKRDALATYRVFLYQDDHSNETFQVAMSMALHLISCWGMRVDPEWTRALDNHYAREEHKLQRRLEEAGLIVDGTLKRAKKRELVAQAWDEIDEAPQLTPKGNISTKKTVLRELQDKGVENPTFNDLIEYNRATKFRSTYLEPLLDAAEVDRPVCPRFNTLVNSGRSSSSGPNVQNFPSRTTLDEDEALQSYEGDSRIEDGVVVGPDIRGCIIPRPGKVFVAADYSSLEMCTLAQVIRNVQGELSPLGRAINNGKDLHLMVASTLADEPYETCEKAYDDGEEWVKRPRRVAKIINYARPVGAGASTVQGQLRQQGVSLSIGEVERALISFDETWPGIEVFERHVDRFQSSYDGPYWVEQHGPERTTSGWRLRLVESDDRSAAMNSLFQGLAADGAKLATYEVQKTCYTDRQSPLFEHANVHNFVHDELVLEVDESAADACGEALSRIMIDAMQVFTPDIRIEAEYEVMAERWRK